MLCNINTGRIIVHKDIRIPPPPPPLPAHISPVERFGQSIGAGIPSTAGISGTGSFPAPPATLAPKSGVLRAEDEDSRVVGESRRADGGDSSDSALMEDVRYIYLDAFSVLILTCRLTDLRRYSKPRGRIASTGTRHRLRPAVCSPHRPLGR